MFNNKEVILEYVKREGPVLPIQVAKKTNSNTMFAGAILSELIANKLIKISYAKVGGSPVYFVSGQEEKLSILYEHLPGKEKEAFTLLKNNKLLVDESQEPSIRFALSQIKDFAFPFTETIINELFKKEPVQEALKEEVKQAELKEEIQIIEKPKKQKTEDKFVTNV